MTEMVMVPREEWRRLNERVDELEGAVAEVLAALAGPEESRDPRAQLAERFAQWRHRTRAKERRAS